MKKIGTHTLTNDQFSGEEKISGYLYLGSLTSIPEGFNPTVGGDLYLGSLTSIPEGFNPTVGGYLDLGSLTSIPEGFNPTVGGDLNLRSLTSIPEGFNPTVGGYLNLGSLTSIPKGFNPTVGGYLYWKNGNKNISAKVEPIRYPIIEWQDGKYVSADGIFTEVIHKKGDIYKVKRINSDKETYLITNGKFHSHGDTLKQAKEDLEFKVISEKLKNEPIKADTMLSIKYYRLLTGACESGCKDWVRCNGLADLEEVRADELLPILEKSNPYGYQKFRQLCKF